MMDFLKYNKRNILGDLYAAEVHMRYAVEGVDKGHMGCVAKHLLHVRNELGEAVSHTKDEDEKRVFQVGLLKTEKLLDKFEEGSLSLSDVRELRKFIEPYTPYSTENCRLCSALTENLNIDRIISNDMEVVIKGEPEAKIPSVSSVFDPFMTPISQITGIGVEDLSTYVALPTLGGALYWGLGHFLTPLGKKAAALLGTLGSLGAVAFNMVDGRAKNDALVFTAVSIATLFDPASDKDLLENLEALKRGDIVGAFINQENIRSLVLDLEEALKAVSGCSTCGETSSEQEASSEQETWSKIQETSLEYPTPSETYEEPGKVIVSKGVRRYEVQYKELPPAPKGRYSVTG